MSLRDIINNALSRWMNGKGPEGDIVLSSRVRLARNLEGTPFPHRMQEEDGNKVLAGVRLAVEKMNNEKKWPKLEFTRLDELSPNEREILVEKHLISPQHATKSRFGAVVLSDDETISIMVNEEDHLRLQILLPGLKVTEAWELANKLDDGLEQTLDIAYDEKRGYLTACPTNVGTGLRASVMMHLPGLVLTKQIGGLVNAIGQFGLTVRGLYGEGTEAAGNIFQISNQITLGRSEEEIINNLLAVVKQIIQQERQARERLRQEWGEQLSDKIWRSYGILRYAQMITSQEAINLLSNVRLGVDLGLLQGVESTVLNELMVLMRPAYLQKLAGKELSPMERDVRRAKLIRERLKLCEVKD